MRRDRTLTLGIAVGAAAPLLLFLVARFMTASSSPELEQMTGGGAVALYGLPCILFGGFLATLTLSIFQNLPGRRFLPFWGVLAGAAAGLTVGFGIPVAGSIAVSMLGRLSGDLRSTLTASIPAVAMLCVGMGAAIGLVLGCWVAPSKDTRLSRRNWSQISLPDGPWLGRLGRALAVMMAPAMLGLIVLGVNFARLGDGNHRLAEQKYVLQQAGLPTSYQESFRDVPLAQNAAPDYYLLGAMLTDGAALPQQSELASLALDPGKSISTHPLTADEITLLRRVSDKVGSSFSAQDIKEMRNTLRNHRDGLDILRRATDKPYFSTRAWLRNGEFPALMVGKILTVARLLNVEGYLLARDGHYREAIETAARGLRVAEHLAAMPDVVQYMVASQIEESSLHTLMDILYQAGDKPGVAEIVRQAIQAHRPTIDLQHTMVGELFYTFHSLDRMRDRNPMAIVAGYFSSSQSRLDEPARHVDLWGSRWVDSAEAKMLEVRLPDLLASGKPYPGRLAAVRDAGQRVQQLNSNLSQNRFAQARLMLLDPGTFFLSFSTPNIASEVQTDAERVAMENEVIAGAALLAYRERHGSFPTSLSQAIAQPPMDPFTGKALQYRRQGQGFVVYTVGVNGDFKGDTSPSNRGPFRAQDGTPFFAYPAPPATLGGSVAIAQHP